MLIPLLFSFITLFATCCIEYGTLTMRRKPGVHIAVRLLSYTVGTSMYLLFHCLGIRQYLAYYCISIIYLFACDYLFTETAPQKIFLFFTDWCFTTFVSALCNWATAWIALDHGRLPIRACLYFASFLVLIPLYVKYGRSYVRETLYLFNRSNPAYAAFPFLALVLFTIFFGPMNIASTFTQFLIMSLFICFIFFTYYLMIMHFHAVFAGLQVEYHLINAERQLALQKRYYAEVDKGLRAQRERLHDMRHHLVAMSALASSEPGNALAQYLSRLQEKYSQSPAQRYCENSVANAVVGGYIGMAEDEGIAVSAELDLPEEIGMDEYELCTLLGNALENAIEACRRISAESAPYAKRYIKMKSKVEQGRLAVRIENSFHDDHSPGMVGFASSKGALGGIGLESVKAVLDLYEGCLNCEKKEGVFVFSAILCLKPAL